MLSSRASSTPSIRALTDGLSGCGGNPIPRSRNAMSIFRVQTRSCAAESLPRSPFEANILRILRNEIEYQLEYAPPEPVCALLVPVTFFPLLLAVAFSSMEVMCWKTKSCKLSPCVFK